MNNSTMNGPPYGRQDGSVASQGVEPPEDLVVSEELRDFEEFMKRREEAARAFVNGKPGPLGRVAARLCPATFFGPGGGYLQGAEQVLSSYDRDSARFEAGETRFDILHMGASGDVAYWVGFQRERARRDGQAEAIPLELRVTEVFRREGGDWKLVHRHADALASESGTAGKR